MSEYKDGFDDGYKFAREEIMEKLSEIDINDIDSWILDRISEMIDDNGRSNKMDWLRPMRDSSSNVLD
jgi:hypothetical protein